MTGVQVVHLRVRIRLMEYRQNFFIRIIHAESAVAVAAASPVAGNAVKYKFLERGIR